MLKLGGGKGSHRIPQHLHKESPIPPRQPPFQQEEDTCGSYGSTAQPLQPPLLTKIYDPNAVLPISLKGTTQLGVELPIIFNNHWKTWEAQGVMIG